MRRRWVYDKQGNATEVTADYVAEPRPAKSFIVGDRHYDGLRATDGADISTRAKHRAYMKANGLTTMDDFKGTWQKAAKVRENIRTGRDPTRREAIERAIYAKQKP